MVVQVGLFSNIYNRMYHPNNIKEETQVIYQDREINFRLLNKTLTDDKDKYNQIKHTDGLLNLRANKKCHIRLYTSTAGIKIDGLELNQVNQAFLSGTTPFVIIENSGKFITGVVNYLTFECVEVSNQSGNSTLEVKVRINVLQEKALGHSSGITDWAPNVHYVVSNDIIGPDGRLYNCIESHTSIYPFDETKWERQGSIDQSDVDDFSEGFDDIIDSFNNP